MGLGLKIPWRDRVVICGLLGSGEGRGELGGELCGLGDAVTGLAGPAWEGEGEVRGVGPVEIVGSERGGAEPRVSTNGRGEDVGSKGGGAGPRVSAGGK